MHNFNDAGAYNTWEKSDFFKAYFANVQKQMKHFTNTIQMKNEEINILDIGTGNGIIITEMLNTIVCDSKIKKINLVLLDKSEDMLRTAEKKLVAEEFWMAEAVNILTQTRENRIDYHTTLEEWKKLVMEAGFTVDDIQPVVVRKDKMQVFQMNLI